MNLITVTVTPLSWCAIARRTRFACVDLTGAPVVGNRERVVIGDTNQTFSHNFSRRSVMDATTWSTVWPAVMVVVPNFPVVPVDRGFREPEQFLE